MLWAGLVKPFFIMENFPRRNQLDKCTPAELAIYNAIEAVENCGYANEKLTEAICKLQEAKELVSDFVDESN